MKPQVFIYEKMYYQNTFIIEVRLYYYHERKDNERT